MDKENAASPDGRRRILCLQRAYGGLFFGQQLQSRHHGEAGVIIADSQYAAVLLGDGSHLQKAEAVAAGILLCGA